MFGTLFKSNFKILMRNKVTVFWTMLFPIILATFFYFAFSNINTKLDPIPISYVKTEGAAVHESFDTFIAELSKEGEQQLFIVSYDSMEEATEKLNRNDVEAIVIFDETLALTFSKNGLRQTIVKSVFDHYLEQSAVITQILQEKPESLATILLEMNQSISYTQNEGSTNNNMMVIYFYSLIGMACIFSGFWGITVVSQSQPNLSDKGMRMGISPVHKLKALLAGLLAAFVIQLAIMAILLIYLIVILNIDFGNQLYPIILLCFFGCAAGITFGSAVGAIPVRSMDQKIIIFVIISNLLSFLSGLMAVQIKFWVEQTIPILSKINPVSLITDGLYSMYYYESVSYLMMNVLYLIGFILVCVLASYYLLRGRNYANL